MTIRLHPRRLALLCTLALLALAPGRGAGEPGLAAPPPPTLPAGREVRTSLPGRVPVGSVPALPARPALPAATLSFTVNSTVDAPDAHPGDGVCADSAGQCTLRAAVQEAGAQPAGSAISISVPAGTYMLPLGTLALTANRIAITGAPGAASIINGDNSGTVIAVSSTVRAALQGLTITGGSAAGDGGGILNQGLLVLSQSAVLSNTAQAPYPAGQGGGIANQGTLLLSQSTLRGNTANGDGGGLYNDVGGTVLLSQSALRGNGAPYGGGGGIANRGTLVLSRSTLRDNGALGRAGGGIANSGRLAVIQSLLSGNTDGYTDGGGIANTGTMTVISSTFSGNATTVNSAGGGAIYNHGTLTVLNSTFSGNTAAGNGGGLYNDIDSTLTVSQSTLSGNTAPHGGGGGIANRGTLTVSQSTLSGNTDSGNGDGGLDNGGMLARVGGTIVADGCSGPISDGGFNLDSGTSCGFSQTSDLTNTNPLLGPLANNGGPTPTLALLAGSPAIDRGGTRAQGCPASDQRGVVRPDGAETRCDMGAYETQGVG